MRSIFKLQFFRPEQIKRKENCGFRAAVTDDKMFVTAFAQVLSHGHATIHKLCQCQKVGPIFNFFIGYCVTFTGVLQYDSLDCNLLQHCTDTW